MVALLSSSADYRILRNPVRPSGFSCVYLKRDGREQYAVRAFRHIHLGNFDTARAGAEAAADWWYSAYGPDWPAVFDCRCRRPWEVVQCPGPVTVWGPDGVCKAEIGVRLVCWELGVRRVVFPPPFEKYGQSPSCFTDRQTAKAYFRKWREDAHGPLYHLMLRRTSRPVDVPKWALARGGPGFPPFGG